MRTAVSAKKKDKLNVGLKAISHHIKTRLVTARYKNVAAFAPSQTPKTATHERKVALGDDADDPEEATGLDE